MSKKEKAKRLFSLCVCFSNNKPLKLEKANDVVSHASFLLYIDNNKLKTKMFFFFWLFFGSTQRTLLMYTTFE